MADDAQPEPSLAAKAIHMLIADTARQTLAALEADRQAILGQWGTRQGLGDEPLETAGKSFVGSAMQDVLLFVDFDEQVGKQAERNHEALASLLRDEALVIDAFAASFEGRRHRVRLANGLAGCLIAADYVRWYTIAAVSLYDLFWAGVPTGGRLLGPTALRFEMELVVPIMVAAKEAVDTGSAEKLRAAIVATKPGLEYERRFFERLLTLAPKGARLSRSVIDALDTAMVVHAAYEIGTGLAGKGGGPPTGGSAVLSGGKLSLTRPVGRLFEWEIVLEHLVLVGGLGAQVILSAPPSGIIGGSGAGADPSDGKPDDGADADPDSTPIKGVPTGPPKPAPDDLYAVPKDAKTAATWKRHDAAAATVESAMQAGKPWSSIDHRLRRRYGYWAMRKLYPEIVRIYRAGLGDIYYGGRLTPGFVKQVLQAKNRRVAFIEVWMPGRNIIDTKSGYVRLDGLELKVGAKAGQLRKVDVIDVTTTARAPHLTGSAAYKKLVGNAFGIEASAFDILLIDGEFLANELKILEVGVPKVGVP